MSSSWVQRGSDIDGEARNDDSGYAVSLSDDGAVVAIGGLENDANGADSGHVRVHAWDGTSWNQRGQDIDGEAAGDRSGTSRCRHGVVAPPRPAPPRPAPPRLP